MVAWCSVKVCGVRDYQVDACSSVPGGNSGDCTYRTGRIRVRFAERTNMEDTLFHEVTHAVWDASGLKDMLRRRLSPIMTAAQIADLEEDILVMQTPGLLGTLKTAGWLKLPRPPKE
jgi:hypothetical protein